MSDETANSSGEADVLFVDIKLRDAEARETFRELEAAAKKAGVSIGQQTDEGVATGLKNDAGKVEQAGKTVGDSAADGMAQGVKSGQGKVEAAADNAATGIKGKLKAGLGSAFDVLDSAGISSGITDIGGAALSAAGPVAAIGVALTAVAAVGSYIAASINVYADLEKELNALKAISSATASEMENLKQQALDLGQSTVYSATEVLGVQQELSKAGVSIADILNGATEGSLLLASATGTDLADAVSVATAAMNVFNLTGRDVAHIADVISNGANQSALDVGTFGEALSAVGKIAPQAGLGLESTTAVLSVFADNALEGSDAGTSLKTMILALLAPSKDAAAQLEQMGVNVYDSREKLNELGVSIKDSSGNLRPFEAIISDLNAKFATMSDQQRNAAMSTIFGTDAVRAASILYDEGVGKVFDYTQAMYQSGTAAENAKTRQEGLRGAQEQLGGAMETLSAKVGSFFAPTMTLMVEGATEAITAISSLVDWLDKLAHGTEMDQLQGDVLKWQTELKGVQEALKIGEDQLKTTSDAGYAAAIKRQLDIGRAQEADLLQKLASAKAAVADQSAADYKTAQSQPGYNGPFQGQQNSVSGAGVFGAAGVGQYKISQEFGSNAGKHGYGAAGHQGIDVATPSGTAVNAAFSGMLTTGFDKNGYGKYIKLIDEKGQALIYGHLSAYANGLEAELRAAGGRLFVAAGKQIGLTGSTGNSTGPHLHLEGRTNSSSSLGANKAVDPRTLDYGGMARPAFTGSSGSGAEAPEWDKLLAKAKELRDVLQNAAPGQARIVAQQNVDGFKKLSDAAKDAYGEIERQATVAGKRTKETDEQKEKRVYAEKIAQEALTKSLRASGDARLSELAAQGIQGQSLEKWEAVKAEIARREKLRTSDGKKDAAELKRQQAEAQRDAEAAAKQADQLAAKSAGSTVEAARVRVQSLQGSRDEAVRAAGENLSGVLAVQQAFAPRIQAASEAEALATLKGRKSANEQWRTEQRAQATATISDAAQLAARLKVIDQTASTENSNAYKAYQLSRSKASRDAGTAIGTAEKNAAEASLKSAASTSVAISTAVAKGLEEATKSAEVASKLADQLAAKATGSAVEAARIRTQSLQQSRETAVRAAGDDLSAVLAVQQTFAPKLKAAAEAEGLATLEARKRANEVWKAEQEKTARSIKSTDAELASSLKRIDEQYQAENTNAYRAFQLSKVKASTDAASAIGMAENNLAQASIKASGELSVEIGQAVNKQLEEAAKNADAASKQAEQIASRQASGSIEAARARLQSLKTSRDQEVKAAGENLDRVLAAQQAFTPLIQQAVEQEALATLTSRKTANQKWRSEQEDAARKTISSQVELDTRLSSIADSWRSENSNAYVAYYGTLKAAAQDSATTVEGAGKRVADAAAAQAEAVNKSRYSMSASLIRYSFGEGEAGLNGTLAAYGVKDTSDVQGALTELEGRAPKIAALIREAYGEEIAQQLYFTTQANAAAAELSQQNISNIQAADEVTATYAGTLDQLTGILGEAIGQGIDPRQSGFLNVLGGIIEQGGEAAKAAQYVKENLDELLAAAGASDLGTILYRGRKALSDAQADNAAPASEGGPSIEQASADNLSGQVLADVFNGSSIEQFQNAITASLSDTFSDIGADGREAFWAKFGELTGSSEFQGALDNLGGPELFALIRSMGDAPEWAELKGKLEARLSDIFKGLDVPPQTQAVEAALSTLMGGFDQAKKSLDAGLIDPDQFVGQVGPMLSSLEQLAQNLDRLGQTGAADSIRQIIAAMQSAITESGGTDPAALARATELAAQTFQESLKNNAASLADDKATYRARLEEELKFWEGKKARAVSGSADYAQASKQVAGLTGTVAALDSDATELTRATELAAQKYQQSLKTNAATLAADRETYRARLQQELKFWEDRKAAAAVGSDAYVQASKNIAGLKTVLDDTGPLAKFTGGMNKVSAALGVASSMAKAFGADQFSKGLGELASGFSSAAQAAVSFSTGDIAGGIMATFNAIGSLGEGILSLDPKFQLWRKSLLEIADAEKKVASEQVGMFKNPYSAELAKDAQNRTSLANAGFWQRVGWSLFGNAPQALEDGAARLKTAAAGIFADLANAISGTLENTLMNSFDTGDWSGTEKAMEKSLNTLIAKMALQAIVAASKLEEKLKAYADARARFLKNDGVIDANEQSQLDGFMADIKKEQVGIKASFQATAPSLPGYGASSPAGSLAELQNQQSSLQNQYQLATNDKERGQLKAKLDQLQARIDTLTGNGQADSAPAYSKVTVSGTVAANVNFAVFETLSTVIAVAGPQIRDGGRDVKAGGEANLQAAGINVAVAERLDRLLSRLETSPNGRWNQ